MKKYKITIWMVNDTTVYLSGIDLWEPEKGLVKFYNSTKGSCDAFNIQSVVSFQTELDDEPTN